MNPARSFGPALVAGEWSAHWLYWLGPLVGALLGATAYQLLKAPRAVSLPEAEGSDG
jgi:glycerol uptake facilitator-like aquaporin